MCSGHVVLMALLRLFCCVVFKKRRVLLSLVLCPDEGQPLTDRNVGVFIFYLRTFGYWAFIKKIYTYILYVKPGSHAGSFVSALYLVLSSIHNRFFLVRCARKQCVHLKNVTTAVRFQPSQQKSSLLQCIPKHALSILLVYNMRVVI